jgi:DnaK suppressor protein
MFAQTEAGSNRVQMDRLVSRRDRIMARIANIDTQLRQLKPDAIEQQRRQLLTYLSSFHHSEIDQVDSALKRLATGKYGLCLACNGCIEADWLESFPEADFCSTCYRVKERMGAG